MRVLVTGGAGYIGSVVAHQLIDTGHDVTVLDDLSSGHADNVPATAELVQKPLHDVAHILTPTAGFDAVIHFAAKIEVAESVSHPERFWDNNIRGTLALFDAMRTARTPRLVFSSTGSLYSGTPPFTEESLIVPQNPYAVTKYAIDMMIAGECGRPGAPLGAAVLRYFNAAGAVQTSAGRWLAERHDPETHLIPILLQCAAGQRDTFTLYGTDYTETPDGTCVRDYIHVADLASAHLAALDDIRPGRYEVFNLGNGNGYTNREVINAVQQVTGARFPVAEAGRRPGDAIVSVAAAHKAAAILGWKPQRPDLTDIIGDAWAAYQSTMP
ncbi:UDP-glucose 4-epimerase [Nocardia otitidiscaviarum]|uniref:UDP-glucose 4-epimerase n=1 Tax=Nocardia otitidiscaviarum TaxID=1823 RepID=A0A379JKW0_9NOCA|nr:UDP-glucose 4-epimerase GalE [Nocardia otitidiscaviarum]SUD48861.1 UDP-glucose 4-epimerase [Nocardia otitidiscaviarum]